MPSELPSALWSGTFNVLGVELKCHVLDTGQRIIEAESMNAFIEAMENRDLDFTEDLTAFFRWQRGD